MKPKKKELSPLDKELKALEISHTRCKNQITFHTSLRTYGFMASCFGREISDPILRQKPIWKDDLEIYAKQIEEQIRDRYNLWRLLPEVCGSDHHKTDSQDIQIIHEFRRTTSFNPKYPDQKATLKVKEADQEGAARDLWMNLEKGLRASFVTIPTQIGKTFIAASFIKNFWEQGWVDNMGCVSPWPIWYITRATVLEQTETVLRDMFNLPMEKIQILNIEAISRGSFGKYFVREEVVVRNNEEEVKYVWTPLMHPCLVIGDEAHMFIRAHSLQSSMFMGLTECENVHFVFMSATLLSRVSEGKILACATHKKFELGMAEVEINDTTWPSFAKQIAAPAAPEEHCIAAKERFTEFFKEHIVKIRNIRPKHKAINKIMPITFRTKEEYDFYNTALERYYKQKAEIEGDDSLSGNQSNMALLAAFTILRHAAEECKVDTFIEFADKTWQEGYAPFLGLAFKRPMLRVLKGLIEQRGWKREDISIIWGGSQETLNKKKKLASAIKSNDELMTALGQAGIDLRKLGIKLDELNEKTNDLLEFEKTHRLLSQSREQREEERLRYKRQDSRLLLYSYKSGGVGLSASHEEGFGNKVRPRQGCLSLVYNEKELVQGIGRPHAITSISETLILFPYYQGTIEEDVAVKVKNKLRCLKAGTGSGESWESIVTGHNETVSRPELFDAVDNMENGLIEV